MQKYLILVLVFISVFSQAQVASDLSPKSLTLPRLSTSQQNTIPPQQAGNVVFNADEKKLAVHDGNEWNYLSGVSISQTSQYKNHKLFTANDSFTVPTGITNILIEVWGNGDNGMVLTLSQIGSSVTCSGGGGGQYVQVLALVNPSEILDIQFDANINFVKKNNDFIAAAYHGIASNGGSGNNFGTPLNYQLIVSGENGKSADFSFQQANAGVFRKIVKGGEGGGTYPTFRNGGNSYTMELDINTWAIVSSSYVSYTINDGKFPGGGGGCGGSGWQVGYGAPGAIIIHY
jgi:hypothetical protein